jgi:hypothetical protein
VTNRIRNQRGDASPALIAIGCLLGLVVLVVGGYAIQYYTADTRGKIAENEAVHADPNYRIAQYNHFYDLCASVQSFELQMDANDARAVDDSFPQSQKDAVQAALQNTRSTNITQYNADARKADTAANFKASDLPWQLDSALYDPKVGNKTSCEA